MYKPNFLLTIFSATAIWFSAAAFSSETTATAYAPAPHEYPCSEILHMDVPTWVIVVNGYIESEYPDYVEKTKYTPQEYRDNLLEGLIRLCEYENTSIKEVIDSLVEDTADTVDAYYQAATQ